MKLTAEQIEAAKRDDRIDGVCTDGEGFCYAAMSCAHIGKCQRHVRTERRINANSRRLSNRRPGVGVGRRWGEV